MHRHRPQSLGRGASSERRSPCPRLLIRRLFSRRFGTGRWRTAPSSACVRTMPRVRRRRPPAQADGAVSAASIASAPAPASALTSQKERTLWLNEHRLLRQLLYRFNNEHRGAGRGWFGRVKEVARLMGRIADALEGQTAAGVGPRAALIRSLELLALLDAVRLVSRSSRLSECSSGARQAGPLRALASPRCRLTCQVAQAAALARLLRTDAHDADRRRRSYRRAGEAGRA